MKNQNVPYKLMIVTDAYTGNFERELISFCLGLDYDLAYTRPFWDKTIGTGIQTCKRYKEIIEEEKNIKMEEDEFFEIIKESSEVLKKIENMNDKTYNELCVQLYKKYKKEKGMKSWLRFYEEFLYETLQYNDDIEDYSFYNICSYGGEEKEYNSIFIQLSQKDIPSYFEYYIIKYIFEFFEDDIYNKIKQYIWICHGWNNDLPKREEMHLKKLLLLDENDNIIKKYKKEDVLKLEEKCLIESSTI